MNEQIETVIIGAGHCGLSMSYYLSGLGREHVSSKPAGLLNEKIGNDLHKLPN